MVINGRGEDSGFAGNVATNHQDNTVTLQGAESPVADRVELHTHRMNDQGVMQMRPLGSVDIPAGGSVPFQPGGDHIMLMGLHQALSPGDRFPLTLQFSDAEDVAVEVVVGER